MISIRGWKILLVFPQEDKQTGLFILRAMKDLGAIVRVVDAKTEHGKTYAQAIKFQPKLIFMSRTPILVQPMKQIRKKLSNVVMACWNVDKRNHVKEFKPQLLELFSMMDIMYTIAKGNVSQYQELFHEKNKVIVRHLQQGCDPLTHKTEILTPEDHKLYDCDVMFAGSLGSCGGSYVRRQREKLIERLKSEPFHFRRYGEKDNRITDTPANKAHLCSKIALGHNGWPDCEISMSVRDYKVMASGGFLLTQQCKGIENWFEIGKMCDIYNGDDECVEKINYYLKKPTERQKIAAYGQQVVLAKHKYIDRIATIGNDVAKVIRSKM